jgi:hypothetical protein
MKWGDRIAKTTFEPDAMTFKSNSGRALRIPLRWPLRYAFKITDELSQTSQLDSGNSATMRLDKNGNVHFYGTRVPGTNDAN